MENSSISSITTTGTDPLLDTTSTWNAGPYRESMSVEDCGCSKSKNLEVPSMPETRISFSIIVPGKPTSAISIAGDILGFLSTQPGRISSFDMSQW